MKSDDDGVTRSSIELNVPGARRRKQRSQKNPGPFAAPEIFVEAQTLLDDRY
jgi:hypothetical protein